MASNAIEIYVRYAERPSSIQGFLVHVLQNKHNSSLL